MKARRIVPVLLGVVMCACLFLFAQTISGTLRKDCETGGHDIFTPRAPRDIALKLENAGDCPIQADVIDAAGNVGMIRVAVGDSAVWEFGAVADIRISCFGARRKGECILNYTIAYQ